MVKSYFLPVYDEAERKMVPQREGTETDVQREAVKRDKRYRKIRAPDLSQVLPEVGPHSWA